MPAVADAPAETRPPAAVDRPAPVLRTTSYDRSSAALLATLIGLLLTTAVITTLYIATRPAAPPKLVPIEIPDEATGGSEDGEPDSTLQVESELAPQPDAAPVEQDSDQIELQETLEVITELADVAAEMVPEQTGQSAVNTGIAGTAVGTGAAALGAGGSGNGGVPRSQRWLVNFSDGASLDEYARQLDFFGIELGVIKSDGTLVFASNLAGTPKSRVVTDGSQEKRLYMSWQGGPRKLADQKLFAKAGVNAEGRPILHFYPKNTENMLALLEKEASNRDVLQVRRTYFDAIETGRGYEFRVRRVIYF